MALGRLGWASRQVRFGGGEDSQDLSVPPFEKGRLGGIQNPPESPFFKGGVDLGMRNHDFLPSSLSLLLLHDAGHRISGRSGHSGLQLENGLLGLDRRE